jgi:hypothetical protein
LRGKIDPNLGKVLITHNEDIASLKQMIMKLAGALQDFAHVLQTQHELIRRIKELTPTAQKAEQLGISVGSNPVVTGEHDEVPR